MTKREIIKVSISYTKKSEQHNSQRTATTKKKCKISVT